MITSTSPMIMMFSNIATSISPMIVMFSNIAVIE